MQLPQKSLSTIHISIYLKRYQGWSIGKRHFEIRQSVYLCRFESAFRCDTIQHTDVDRTVQCTQIELSVHSAQRYLLMAKIKLQTIKELRYVSIKVFYDHLNAFNENN